MLVSRVRGTVQGMVGVSLHLLWYLDWQIGGRSARSAPTRQQARRAPERPAA
jgi:hypothetical protein